MRYSRNLQRGEESKKLKKKKKTTTKNNKTTIKQQLKARAADKTLGNLPHQI
jgi:hypothetical protein